MQAEANRPPADVRPVSVILTYHRAGELIFESAASVLGQSHGDLELLLVDDNGPGRLQTEFLRRRIQDPRVRFLVNPEPGRVRALSFGVAQASHDICAIIDDDDLWGPDKLAWDLAALNRDRGIEFVCWHRILFQQDLKFPKFDREPRLERITPNQMLIRNRVIHASVTCYKDRLQYDTRLQTSEDYEVCLRMQAEGLTLYRYDQPRVGYRVHDSHFMSRKLASFYWRSASIQARYIMKWRRYHLLVFPALRVIYTLIRRRVNLFKARHNRLTLAGKGIS